MHFMFNSVWKISTCTACATILLHIFSTEYNYDFHQPKKDRCNFCEAHRVKAENGLLTEDDKARILTHNNNKTAMRENRKIDREMRDGDVAVVSFDLQNVITCPRAEISCFFYKRKLNVYNETAVASICGKKQAICAIWTETTSGREGNDIASSVVRILEETVKLKPDVKTIITWSDSCVPQNKNAMMSTAILNFLDKNPQIESVEMKYSLSGHSAVQEVDRVHSALEKSFAISEFYSPVSLLNVIMKTSRQNPYKVIQMRDNDFLNFKKFCISKYEFKIVPFTKVSALKFTQGSTIVGYKTSHADDLYVNVDVLKRHITTRKNKNGATPNQTLTLEPKVVKQTALSKEKLKDLKDMLQFMPLKDREYYEKVHKI